MGFIREADDRFLHRRVAIKLIREDDARDPESVESFLGEARVQGSLEHPSIAPVYDLGRLRDGSVYFAQRRVTGRSLHQILEGLRSGDGDTRADFGRARLLAIFQQVCGAISYAHANDVVHCDLKPDNVMVGEFGEVYVVDWGLSRSMGEEAGAGGASRLRGTPAYLAPERLGGDASVTPSVDVYSLGGILYAILSYAAPHEGRDTAEILERVAAGDVERPSVVAPENEVPIDLEEVALKAMAPDPGERFASVRDLARAVEEFQEGTKTRARRVGDAAARVGAGIAAARRFRELKAEMSSLRDEVARLARELQPFDPIETKRPLWETEQELRSLDDTAFRAFGAAEDFFQQALGFIPDLPAARNHLASLYWDRMLEAEESGDHSSARYFATLVRRYGDGRYEQKLRGEGLLAVECETATATVELRRVAEIDRLWVPARSRSLGETPVEYTPTPMGSYVLEVVADGYRTVLCPVRITRAKVRVRLRLYTDAEIGADFVFVPAGRFIMGGDQRAPESVARGTPEVSDFFIARFPVTCGDYLEYMEDLLRRAPEEAAQRIPRYANGRALWVLEGGQVRLPEGTLAGTDADWSPQWPVSGISFEDARAYCDWRSFRDGVNYRLPTEQEWEKAAGGWTAGRTPGGTSSTRHSAGWVCHGPGALRRNRWEPSRRTRRPTACVTSPVVFLSGSPVGSTAVAPPGSSAAAVFRPAAPGVARRRAPVRLRIMFLCAPASGWPSLRLPGGARERADVSPVTGGEPWLRPRSFS